MSTPASVGLALQAFIASETGRECGLNEAPEHFSVSSLPAYIIRPIPGPEMEGSMGQPSSLDDQVFNIDVVGVNNVQVDAAEKRMVDALAVFHRSTVGVMGPPVLRRNGTSREDDRIYRAMVIATIPTTGT